MISIAPCADYSEKSCEKALETAINAINGLDWVQPGMKVGIKANLVSMLKPEAAATTHPSLICVLVRMLIRKGAEVVVGDSPGGLYNQLYLDRVYAATGMKQVEKLDAHLNHDFSCAEAVLPDAKKAKKIEYTAWLDSCDGIINFCKLKTHGMMGMSAAVKNMFGAVPGTRKPEMHYLFPDAADFADMLVDINEFFKPNLCIVDAVTGMEGNGPTSGTPRDIGCVIAGASAYEVDMACADIIGIDEAAVPTLSAARNRGLAPEKYEICGDIAPFIQKDVVLPPKHDVQFFAGSIIGKALSKMLSAKPMLKPQLCVGCEKCKNVCPADAIVMRDKKPVIDRKKCIRCFCCQEFCPKAAMICHRPAIARMLNK